MLNTMFTYKQSFLLHQEFIVEYNIIIATQFVNIEVIKQTAVFEV